MVLCSSGRRVEVLRWIVPVLGAGMLLSLAAQLAQGGFTIAPEALQPKPDGNESCVPARGRCFRSRA